MDQDGVPIYFTRLRQLREFVKPISSFTRPATIGEATARIGHNLTYFGTTYAMLVLSIIYLRFLFYPILMIFFATVYSSWLFLYFCLEDGPVEVSGWTVDDQIVLAVPGVFTVLFILVSGVWLNVLVSILIGFAIVVIHATFRGTEDLPSELRYDDVQWLSSLSFPEEF